MISRSLPSSSTISWTSFTLSDTVFIFSSIFFVSAPFFFFPALRRRRFEVISSLASYSDESSRSVASFFAALACAL